MIKLVFLISLIIMISLASGLEFTQQIDVSKGLLYTKTSSDQAKDLVNSVGHQTYNRDLYLEKDKSSLQSEYHLLESQLEDNSSIKDYHRTCKIGSIGGSDGYDYYRDNEFASSSLYNRYSIRMDSVGGLSHFIDVRTKSEINADNMIVNKNKSGEIYTDFNVNSGWGEVYEGVVRKNPGQRPTYLVENRIYGQPEKIESHLSETETVPALSETQFQTKKLESVEMTGEVGQEVYSPARTKIRVESSSGSLEIEKESTKVALSENQELNLAKIKTRGLIGEERATPEKENTQARGIILFGEFNEEERIAILDSIENNINVHYEPATDEDSSIKPAGYALVGGSDNEKESKSFIKKVTELVSAPIRQVRGFILIGDFEGDEEKLKGFIENSGQGWELVHVGSEKGSIVQASSYAIISDANEAENLDLIRNTLQDATKQVVKYTGSGSTVSGPTVDGSTHAIGESSYGLIGEFEPGEEEALITAIENVSTCKPSNMIVIGQQNTLCRIPRSEVGRVVRKDGYFKG